MLALKQTQRLGRHRKIETHLTGNSTIVNTYVPLKTILVKYSQLIDSVDPESAKKAATTKGITATKDTDKLAFATYYEAICAGAYMFCADEDSTVTDLLPEFNYSDRQIYRLKDEEIAGFAERVNEVITDKLMALPGFDEYGITADDLTDGTDLANTFSNWLGKVGEAGGVKTAANEEIENKLDKLDDMVEHQITKAMKRFKTKESTFFNAFVALNKIDNIGTRHTNVGGDVTKDGQPLVGATLAITGQTKTAVTNLLGRFELNRVKSGLAEMTCTHPIHGTKTQLVKIKKGRTIEVDWEY